MVSFREREALRLIRPSNRKLNEVRYSPNETPLHVGAKKVLCSYFDAIKKNYVTEAIFETGGRADIFLLDDLTVVEILVTESLAEFQEKIKSYPKGLKAIAIQVKA